GVGYVGMAFGHVYVASALVGDDIRRVCQCLWRISPHAGFSKRHEDLALRAEFDDDAAFVLLSGELFEVICTGGSRVGDPHIAVSIHMDAMRPHEHPAAKAADLFT